MIIYLFRTKALDNVNMDIKPIEKQNEGKQIIIERSENSKPIVNLTQSPYITSNDIGVSHSSLVGSVTLIDIEIVYNKYFSKSVQGTTVVIANMLYIMFLSKTLFEIRFREVNNYRDESQKRSKKHDLDQMSIEHKNVLGSKLKGLFMEVTSTFEKSDFQLAIHIFFLGISKMIKVLQQFEFENDIFKNVVNLLLQFSNDYKLNHFKIFELMSSNYFLNDCNHLNGLIYSIQKTSHRSSGRMNFFFVSEVNSQIYFQGVISAMITRSKKNFNLLVGTAITGVLLHLKFQYSSAVHNTTLEKCLQRSFKVNATVNNPVVDDFKVPAIGTYQ